MGQRARLAWRRALHRRGWLSAQLLAALVAAALLVFTLGGAATSATSAVRTAIDRALDGAPAWEVRTRVAPDPGAQDAAVREVIEAETSPMPVQVGRRLETEAAAATSPSGEGRVSVATTAQAAVVLHGTWPGAGEVLVPAGEAAVAGVGETLVVRGEELAVVGTWAPAEPAGPGSLRPDGGSGPLLVGSEEAVLALDPGAFVFWDVRIEPESLDVAWLEDVATVADRIDAGISARDGVAVRGLQVSDALATEGGQLAGELAERSATSSTISLVAVALIAIAGGGALWIVTRQLARARAEEDTLISVRGGRPANLRWASALEAALVTLLAAGVGGTLAALAVEARPGGVVPWELVPVVAAGLALVCVAAGLIPVHVSRAGRRRAATVGALVAGIVLVALTVLAVRAYTEHEGVMASGGADPLAVLAIPLLLLVGAFAVAALVPLATLLVEAAARRGRGLGVLSAAMAARSARRAVTVVVLLAFAVGALTVAGMVSGTVAQQRARDAAVGAGGDVVLTLPAGPAAGGVVDVEPYRALAGVDAAEAVTTLPITILREPAQLVGVPIESLGEQIALRLGAEDAEALRALTPDASTRIPEGTTTLAVGIELRVVDIEGVEESEDFQLEDLQVRLGGSMVLIGSNGELIEAQAEEREITVTGEPQRFEVEVPLEAGATSVADVELSVNYLLQGEDTETVMMQWYEENPDASEDESWEFFDTFGTDGRVDYYSFVGLGMQKITVTADAAPLLEAGLLIDQNRNPWVGDLESLGGGELKWGASGYADPLIVNTQEGGGDPANPDPGARALPALITQALAKEFDVEVGGSLNAAIAGPSVPLAVAGILGTVPGTLEERAVMVDRNSLTAMLAARGSQPRTPGEVWLMSGADPQALAEEALAVAPEGTTATLATPSAADPSGAMRSNLWIAAAGASAIAIVVATLVGLAGGREDDVALRALGASHRRIGRARAVQFLIPAVLGALGGMAVGWLVGTRLAPALARQLVEGSTQVAAAVSWPELATYLAAVALLLGLAVATIARAAARRARTARVGGL